MAVEDTVFFGCIALFLGVVASISAPILRAPYSVVLLLLGLLLGYGSNTYVEDWRYFATGASSWQDIDPRLLAVLFLPPLLYSGSQALPGDALVKAAPHVFILGCLAVGTATVMTAIVGRYLLPYSWSWTQSLLFGAIVAATDPVAAVSLLQQVGAPLMTRVTVDGEALVDDGVAAVLFSVFHRYVEAKPVSAGDIIRTICRQSFGGPAIGIAAAACLLACLRLELASSQPLLITTASVCAAWATYFIAEEILHTSGILAVVALGMAVAVFGKRICKAATVSNLHSTWEHIEHVANTLVFVILGAIIAAKVYLFHYETGIPSLTAKDYGYAVVVWLMLLVIRIVNLVLFWPLLARTGHGFSWRDAVVTAWSGMRGVVGMVLALLVYVNPAVADAPFKQKALFLMSTTIVLTVVVQGSSYRLLLKVLGLDQKSTAAATTSNTVEGALSSGHGPPV